MQSEMEVRSKEVSMFLLNNIHDRSYSTIYRSIPQVMFDISDAQLKNAKNREWSEITEGSIACVVNSSRKISTFYYIEANKRADAVDESDNLHVLTGPVIGKLPDDTDMTTLLNRYRVSHRYLPRNVFSVGFNVANLKDSLDALSIKTRK